MMDERVHRVEIRVIYKNRQNQVIRTESRESLADIEDIMNNYLQQLNDLTQHIGFNQPAGRRNHRGWRELERQITFFRESTEDVYESQKKFNEVFLKWMESECTRVDLEARYE